MRIRINSISFSAKESAATQASPAATDNASPAQPQFLRVSDAERRNLYNRTLGAAGGDEGAESNRRFDNLWLRFVSSVSTFGRRDRFFGATSEAARISAQPAGKPARDR